MEWWRRGSLQPPPTELWNVGILWSTLSTPPPTLKAPALTSSNLLRVTEKVQITSKTSCVETNTLHILKYTIKYHPVYFSTVYNNPWTQSFLLMHRVHHAYKQHSLYKLVLGISACITLCLQCEYPTRAFAHYVQLYTACYFLIIVAIKIVSRINILNSSMQHCHTICLPCISTFCIFEFHFYKVFIAEVTWQKA